MTDKEFYDWFVQRAEKFADVGVMHPSSEWGKLVRISLIAYEDRFAEIEVRMQELEKQIKSKRKTK